MNIETAGAGAGGGLLGALLAWLGVSKRLDKLEDGTVWRETCRATHKSVDDSLARIETKLDKLTERIK